MYSENSSREKCNKGLQYDVVKRFIENEKEKIIASGKSNDYDNNKINNLKSNNIKNSNNNNNVNGNSNSNINNSIANKLYESNGINFFWLHGTNSSKYKVLYCF